MYLTKHVLARCRQRGIREAELELIMSFGTKVRKPGGASEFFVSRKDKQKALEFSKQCIQGLDKLAGKSVVIDEDGHTIITAYYKAR